jgi:hypothetical protein
MTDIVRRMRKLETSEILWNGKTPLTIIYVDDEGTYRDSDRNVVIKDDKGVWRNSERKALEAPSGIIVIVKEALRYEAGTSTD